jgi:hypothetical protein
MNSAPAMPHNRLSRDRSISKAHALFPRAARPLENVLEHKAMHRLEMRHVELAARPLANFYLIGAVCDKASRQSFKLIVRCCAETVFERIGPGISVTRHGLSWLRQSFESCQQFRSVNLASNVSLENFISPRFTKYTLEPVVRISLSQRFPPAGDFLAADTDLYRALANFSASFSIVDKLLHPGYYTTSGSILLICPEDAWRA